MILAAIDIGSNAARLLIMQTTTYQDGTVDYTKLSFLRIPLRLGIDVFQTGRIGEQRAAELMDAMKAFSLLAKIFKVDHLKACATSAMRDARNQGEITKAIRAATGIDIQVISGKEEANILYETHIAGTLDSDQSFLYIDVGGGSTELILFAQNRVLFKESFNIGTIRLMNNTVSETQVDQLKNFIKSQTRDLPGLKAIGTGGNINEIFSMSKIKDGKSLTLKVLKDYLKAMAEYTVEQRMHHFHLKRDRADVIVPALQIYTSIMRWGNIKHIFVPKVGLVDGLIKMLYQQYQD